MKVAVFERFGGPEVLEFVDLQRPDPADDEILIKVHATTVTAAEVKCGAAGRCGVGSSSVFCGPGGDDTGWAWSWPAKCVRRKGC